MAKMVSMKGTGDAPGMTVAEAPDDEYPWGLRIHLEDDQLAKLGIDMMPDPGAKRMMMAKVEIVSTDIHNRDGEKRRSMSLQITDMKLSDEDVRDGAAETLYGSGERD
ncbi:capsid staple protein [Halomonas salifodinae]|uniref:Capsid staple protein n=1 Tax=Halomonas salifodinae TaxID=438745 RepID=A0ABW2F1V1_9GAMM